MRHIERLPEPDILKNKGKQWLEKFLESNKPRPDNKKYAHKDIVATLEDMSQTKCFYCECSLKDEPKEVDHHIEVSIDKSGAFKWDNLYLSCPDCNDKLNHNTIAIEDALDPIVDSDEEIKKNIYYEEESIFERNGSTKGRNTIKKYKLSSTIQDNKRRKHLQKLYNTVIKCLEKGGRAALSEEDKEAFRRYANNSSPYSYMCECYLKKHFPEVLN